MNKLISFIKNKPAWIQNEGLWRIVQSLRCIAAFMFVLLALVALSACLGSASWEYSPYLYGWAGILFVVFPISPLIGMSLVHGVAWTLCWIAAGFKESERA